MSLFWSFFFGAFFRLSFLSESASICGGAPSLQRGITRRERRDSSSTRSRLEFYS